MGYIIFFFKSGDSADAVPFGFEFIFFHKANAPESSTKWGGDIKGSKGQPTVQSFHGNLRGLGLP